MKVKIVYLVMAIISVIMIVTKGLYGNVIIYSYDSSGVIADGMQGSISLSVINCLIIAIIVILAIIMTFNKNNKLKIKWILFGIVILLVLLIPIGSHSYSGGIAGIIGEEYIYVWNLMQRLLAWR